MCVRTLRSADVWFAEQIRNHPSVEADIRKFAIAKLGKFVPDGTPMEAFAKEPPCNRPSRPSAPYACEVLRGRISCLPEPVTRMVKGRGGHFMSCLQNRLYVWICPAAGMAASVRSQKAAPTSGSRIHIQHHSYIVLVLPHHGSPKHCEASMRLQCSKP